MSQIRRTMNNLTDVVGGELLLRAANVGVVVLIGRVYGVAVLGMYAAILAIATVAERVADNGLELTGIAEVSRQPEDLGKIATALYFDKTVLSAAAVGLLALAGWIAGFSGVQWWMGAILAVRTFLYSYCRLNAGLLKALDKTRQILAIQALHVFLLTGCLLIVYQKRLGLKALLLCLVTMQIVEFSATSAVVLRGLGLRVSSVSFSLCWNMIRRSTPVGMTYTFSTLMLRGDVVVLSLIAPVRVVGTFAAANTALVMVYVIAWLLSGVLLSDLGSLSRNQETFDAHFRACIRGVLALGVPLAAASVFSAPIAIRFVFGRNFEAADVPGALMMIAMPSIFLNATFLSRAIARSASRTALAIYGYVAILSLLMNYSMGRWYGASGVACSIVMREALITLAFVRCWNLRGQPFENAVPFKANAEFGAMQNS